MSKITDFFSRVSTAPAPSSPASVPAQSSPAAVDYETILREARELAPGAPQPFCNVMWVDETLHRTKAIPRYSPWWRAQLREFYVRNAADPHVTMFAARAGRGSGKSTGSQKFVAAETMIPPADRRVPVGERWGFAFVSLPQDAGNRIRGLAATIDIFGRETRVVMAPRAMLEIKDLLGNDIAIVALPCTVAGLSGPTLVGFCFDETAKWHGSDRSAVNNAAEIFVSGVAACRGRLVRTMNISSAFGRDGYHFETIKKGSTDATHVARIGPDFVEAARKGFRDVAMYEHEQRRVEESKWLYEYADRIDANCTNIPTWLGNPTIGAVTTRRQVQDLPPSELKGFSPLAYWAREWGSIPLDPKGKGSGAWTAEDWATALDFMRNFRWGLTNWSGRTRGGGGSSQAPERPMLPAGFAYDSDGRPQKVGSGWGRGGASL